MFEETLNKARVRAGCVPGIDEFQVHFFDNVTPQPNNINLCSVDF